MSCYIIGSGAALPARVVTNAELAPRLGVTPDWIETNSGIRERRWVDAEQSTSDLAALAARDAILDAGIVVEQVDYLLACTISPDYQTPGIAPLVQRKLECCRQIPALDLRVACSAILYSLQVGGALIDSKAAGTVLCCAAEAQSKGLDLSSRSADLSMLFGDGAGALILSNEPQQTGNHFSLRVVDVLTASDGSFAEDLIVRAPGTANGAQWLDAEQLKAKLHQGSMNGRTVIMQAVKKLVDAATLILHRNEVTIAQVSALIPHQANANLLRILGERLKFPPERIIRNIEFLGNTGGASAFLALSQAQREMRLKSNSYVLILAFGAGFSWGAALCEVCH